ncbi:MAG: DUF2779 domain-containing protein [Gemmatimonadota bacterium]|nr:DUF2779 domain-containing protein [Gemmatimonadota bacterium]
MTDHYALTKRTFLAGAQCLKRLWWEMYDLTAPETRPSIAARFRMDEGIKVGIRAREYVPGGTLISRGGRSLRVILDESDKAIRNASIPAIYEAAVISNDVLVFPDILQRIDGGFSLIEVKSKTSVSESKHIPDIAVQAYVLRSAGVPVIRCEIMHLNRECRYPDLSNLFVREDVTEMVEMRLETIAAEIRSQLLVTRLPIAPNVETGPQCNRPDPCPFIDRCWPETPSDHVTTLYRVSEKMLTEFAASGWNTIRDLPDDVKLGAIAARQRRALREGHRVVEREALLKAMSTLVYPVAHIDFETIQPAIPVWDGCRPYDQIPVQLSCHIVEADHTERHFSWLFDGVGDPRPGMAKAILDACRSAATITTYSPQFERSCIEFVARACPEHAAALGGIAGNLVDLMPIVRDHVYDEKFGGSFSIKKVLPALAPEMSYDDLEISDGETASVMLAKLIFGGSRVRADEREQLRHALLKYGEHDTKGMVVLSNTLAGLASLS